MGETVPKVNSEPKQDAPSSAVATGRGVLGAFSTDPIAAPEPLELAGTDAETSTEADPVDPDQEILNIIAEVQSGFPNSAVTSAEDTPTSDTADIDAYRKERFTKMFGHETTFGQKKSTPEAPKKSFFKNLFKKKSTNNGHEVLADVGIEAPDEQAELTAPAPVELEPTEPQPEPADVPAPVPEPAKTGFEPFTRKGETIDLGQDIAKDVKDFTEHGISRPDVGIPYSELDAAYKETALDENGEAKDEFTLESILAEFGSTKEPLAPAKTNSEPVKPIVHSESIGSAPEPLVRSETDEDSDDDDSESGPIAEMNKILAESQAYLAEYQRLMNEINTIGQKFYQNVARANALQAQIATSADPTTSVDPAASGSDPSRRFNVEEALAALDESKKSA